MDDTRLKKLPPDAALKSSHQSFDSSQHYRFVNDAKMSTKRRSLQGERKMRIASIATAVVLAFSANVYASYMDSLRARCEAYGSTPGTRDFYQCLNDMNAQEERKREQKPLESALIGCNTRQAMPGTENLANAVWSSQPATVSQLSPVSLSTCPAQVQ